MIAPPPLPSKQKPDWWSRNWKWFVPLIVVFVMGLGVTIGAATLELLKSNEAYQIALARAQQSAELQEKIGAPIEAGWLVTGNVNWSNGSGQAELTIPIRGPQGDAIIYVVAFQQGGEWEYEHLIVKVVEPEAHIDLR